MIEVKGKKGTAIVYNDDVEETALDQIKTMMDSDSFEGMKVRVMPDIHAGKGSVIGFTATYNDKIIPNIIGVDIGCGVTCFKLPKTRIDFEKLHDFIMEKIPSGFNIRRTPKEYSDFLSNLFENITDKPDNWDLDYFLSCVKEVCERQEQDYGRVTRSLGTLGGGNHFIEIDKDEDGNMWLLIHSGSRNFGLKVATYHQNRAKKLLELKNKIPIKQLIEKAKAEGRHREIHTIIKKAKEQESKSSIPKGLEYLEGEQTLFYIADMKIAQVYAQLNRRIMGYLILEFLGLDYFKTEQIESVHNYINFNDNIVRKGAISAHKGEKVLIPLNMRDGVIIGIGKGNEEWNYSAPHGAGRTMSRTKARKNINLNDFKDSMKGVWTKCVNESTLDESPFAYKDSEIIKGYLHETVDIIKHIKPVFNFKDHIKKKKKINTMIEKKTIIDICPKCNGNMDMVETLDDGKNGEWREIWECQYCGKVKKIVKWLSKSEYEIEKEIILGE